MKIFQAMGAALVLSVLTACAGFSPGIIPLREEPVPGSHQPERGFEKEDLIKQGETLIQKGHYTAALKVYREVAEQYAGEPYSGEVLYRLGLLTLVQEDSREASDTALNESRKMLQTLIREFPKNRRIFEAENIINLLDQIKKMGEENGKLKADLQKLLDLDIQSEKQRKALQ